MTTTIFQIYRLQIGTPKITHLILEVKNPFKAVDGTLGSKSHSLRREKHIQGWVHYI